MSETFLPQNKKNSPSNAAEKLTKSDSFDTPDFGPIFADEVPVSRATANPSDLTALILDRPESSKPLVPDSGPPQAKGDAPPSSGSKDNQGGFSLDDSLFPTVEWIDSAFPLLSVRDTAQSAVKETSTATGAKIWLDDKNTARRIERTNGSSVILSTANSGDQTIITTDSNNSNRTTWTKDADGAWISDSNPPAKRQSMQLEPNGNLTFKSADGTPGVITGKGITFEGDLARNVSFDDQGRIDRISYPNGKIRAFGYRGNETDPSAMSSFDRKTGVAHHFEQTAKDYWHQVDVEGRVIPGTVPWSGHVSLSERGTYSTKPNQGSQTWDVTRVDGHKENVLINNQGIELGYNDNRQLVSATRGSRGVRAQLDEQNKPVQFSEIDRTTGKQTNWTRANDGSFNSQGNAPRYEMKLLPDGSLSWKTAEGKQEVAQLPPSNAVPDAPSRRPQSVATDIDRLAADEPKKEGEGTILEETAEVPEVSRIKTTKDAFQETARQKGMDVARLGQFMEQFENRVLESRRNGLQAPTDEQIAKTYETFNTMLKGQPQQNGFSDRERAEMVKTAMYNIADPKRICQGLNMCNVTTAEIFTASRHPENYARLLKEVSLTGNFTTSSGEKITPPHESLIKDEEQGKYTTENVGQNRWRNWASKVFQSTGANSVVPFLNPNTNYPAWGKPYVSGKTDMSLPQIQSACEKINGEKMPYFPNADAPTAEELLALKEKGDFPAGIHTVHVQDTNTGVVSGLHVQTLQDVRMRDGQVQVLLDNQRGGAADEGWISLPDLHRIQQFTSLTSKWYDIPSKYQGQTFDKLPLPNQPRPEAQPEPQKPPQKPGDAQPEPQTPPQKPGDAPPAVPSEQTEHKQERPDAAAPGPLEARRELEEALFEGVKKGPLKGRREDKVREILNSIERRVTEDRNKGLTKATDQDIARAYRSATEALKDTHAVIPYEQRHKMILEGLRNISDPLGIDQGYHGTCGNTCAEKYIAVRKPDVYMDALRQVSHDGTYTTQGGRQLKLPFNDVRQGSFGNLNMTWQRGWMPDTEATEWDVYKESGWHPLKSNESRRNYASQIMQNLNIADAFEAARLNELSAPTGVDALNFLHVEAFTKRMTGKPMTTINQRVQTEGNIMQPLDDDLALKLKRDDRLPAMVWRTWHWQTIHDVRQVQGTDAYGRPAQVVQVLSDNQWGNSRDRGWVTVPQLHQELSENQMVPSRR